VFGALRNRWPAGDLRRLVGLPRSCYYYHLSRQLARAIKAEARRAKGEAMRMVFERNWRAYGYRRLHDAMGLQGTKISEGLVRSLTDELGMRPSVRRRRKYSSYMGGISPVVPNLPERDFQPMSPVRSCPPTSPSSPSRTASPASRPSWTAMTAGY
jgi:hypothetical protein